VAPYNARIMPPIAGLRVVNSGIHGYGVVAERDFAPGDTWSPSSTACPGTPRSRTATTATRCGSTTSGTSTCSTRRAGSTIPARPNCDIEGGIGPDGAEAWARVVAMRAIRAGEEITYDYGFTAELAEPCLCGTPSCRGWIVDESELPRLLEMKAS
jgi:hypothetical protein